MWQLSGFSIRCIGIALLCIFCTSCSRHFTVVKAKFDDSGDVQSRVASSTSISPDKDIRDALLLYRQGNLDRSREMFVKVLENDPMSWQSHYYLGRILTQLDEVVEAEEQLLLALDYTPKDKKMRSMVYLGLAILYEGKGELGKAELNYRTALNLNPQSRQAIDAVERLSKRAQR